MTAQVPLEDVAVVVMGTSPKSDTYNQEGVGLPLLNGPTEFGPSYPNSTLFTTDSKRECKAGDLIFCVRGSTTGRMNWADQTYSLGRGVCCVRGETLLDTKYIRYCLEHKLRELLNLAGGGTFPNLTTGTIKRFPIPFPASRHKVASVLSAYDDLIENNTRRIEVLEEMVQRIYREWFVHFRFPGHEKVGMLDSKLGLIPKGWKVKKLSKVASVHRGRSYRSAEIMQEGGLPFLTLKCIDRDGGFRREGIKRYKGPYKEAQRTKPGDIIMAVTDMTQERRIIARAARVPALGQDTSVFSMDLVKIEPDVGVASEYLYGMLRFSTFPDQVKQHANGANVLHLNPSRIEDYDFVLPPTELSIQYAKLCSDIYSQIDLLHLKNNNLRHTRDLLLPKLISGEVDVEEVGVNYES